MDRLRIGRYEIEVARRRRDRMRGLRDRDGLSPGGGLLLPRCRSIHTFGMRFPIDAVLLDRTYRVVRVVTMVPRRILLPRPGVRHVLEVPAGQGPVLGLRLRIGPPS
jgi:hypothetical protein